MLAMKPSQTRTDCTYVGVQKVKAGFSPAVQFCFSYLMSQEIYVCVYVSMYGKICLELLFLTRPEIK